MKLPAGILGSITVFSMWLVIWWVLISYVIQSVVFDVEARMFHIVFTIFCTGITEITRHDY